MIARRTVDLDRAPAERWTLDARATDTLRALVDGALTDLGDAAAFTELVELFAAAQVRAEHRAEVLCLAEQAGRPYAATMLASLYYDVVKHALMCTAFAVDAPTGPVLARNLDWTDLGGVLCSGTEVIDFVRGGALRYRVVGWPGHVGCYTGVAPGRFAVSLNAVVSDEPAGLDRPVTLLLRETLEEARDFDDALRRLAETPIVADAILTVAGVEQGELAVVERTPTRASVRRPESRRFVLGTNDYRSFELGGRGTLPGLSESASTRYACADRMLSEAVPKDAEECLAILSHRDVIMGITLQQIVMDVRTGAVVVRARKDELTVAGIG